MKAFKNTAFAVFAMTLGLSLTTVSFAEKNDDSDFDIVTEDTDENSEAMTEEIETAADKSAEIEETETDSADRITITDLKGSWKTVENDGMWMEAAIDDYSITIEWVSGDDGSTKSIYWVGSCVLPANADNNFSWISERDEDAMGNIMFASSDTIKKFAYSDGLISVSVDAFGETTEKIFYQYDSAASDNKDTEEGESSRPKNNSAFQEEADNINDEAEVTFGQQNALEKAQMRLNSSAYSYEGLIKELKSNGFTDDEAKFAADACGADWYEQALKKAQRRLDSSAYSYTGLIKELKSNGFTDDEAEYAADACGADWYDQAVKKAQNLLNSNAYSRDGLIKRLKSNEFTDDEAEYAADAVGY